MHISRTRSLLPLAAAVLALSVVVFFALVLAASAADAGTIDPTPSPRLWLPTDQLWTWIAAAVGFLPMYLVNHYAPWMSEPAKGIAQGLVAAVVAGITQAITAGGVGFNQTTLQFIITAVGAAFMAHVAIWKSTGINTKLKAGSNRQAAAAGG